MTYRDTPAPTTRKRRAMRRLIPPTQQEAHTVNAFTPGQRVIFREEDTGPAEPATVELAIEPGGQYPNGGEYLIRMDGDARYTLAWWTELSDAEQQVTDEHRAADQDHEPSGDDDCTVCGLAVHLCRDGRLRHGFHPESACHHDIGEVTR